MNHNKYSNFKIVGYPEKLKSFIDCEITAPIYVRLKMTNRCNQRCSWCGYASPISDMHPTCDRGDEIPAGRVLALINEIADMGTKAILFSGGGEPLIHPIASKAFDLCKERGLKFALITNGQNLNSEMAQHLVSASWVRLSVDYWDGESIASSRGVSPKMFGVIMDNWQNFIEVKDPACDAEINFITTKENYKHIEEACAMVKAIGSENIRFCPMYNNDFINYHIPIKDEVNRRLANARKLYEDDSFHVYSSYDSIDDVPLHRPYNKCYFCQINPVIGADLQVYACHDRAYDYKGIVGSLKDKTFKELWFSEEAKKFFNEFDAQRLCDGDQCSSEKRNLNIYKLLESYGDPYI